MPEELKEFWANIVRPYKVSPFHLYCHFHTRHSPFSKTFSGKWICVKNV